MRKFLLLAAVVLLARSVSAQTADEVVARYIAARGGLAKIKAVKSERVTGTISFGPHTDGPFIVERERPQKMHMEITVTGKILIRVYDGKSAGWVYNAFLSSPSVQPMSEAEVRGVFEEADFEGPFVDSKAKGNLIELVGKAEVDGKPAWKLKLTNRNGEVSYFLFDAVTGLNLEVLETHKNGDQEIASETYFRDFREVNGLKYPFVIESSTPNTEQKRTITAEKIEVNIPIDPSRFAKPVPPPDAAAPAPAPATDPSKPN
jgi:outer membrane lipoprotein-sorting protein